MNKIELELQGTADELLSGIDNSIDALQNLQGEAGSTQKVVEQAFRAGAEATANYVKEQIVASGAAKQLNKETTALVQKLYDEGKVMEALILKYGTAGKALSALKNELKTMAALGQQNTDEFRELQAVTVQLQEATLQQTDALKALQSQYKQLVNDAIAAGGAQTEAGRAILLQAGRVKDEINDIRAATNNLSSDTQGLDAVSEGISLIGDAVQGASGVMVGLNNNVKAYSELSSKLTAILATNNAFQNLANKLQNESKVSLALSALAQKAYTFVVGTSTGALKAFRIALAATGVGLAVIGIAALITNWDKLRDALLGVNKEQNRLNLLKADAVKSTEEERVAVSALVIEYKNENTTKERRKAIIEELKSVSPAYFGQLNEEKTTVEQLTKAYEKWAEAIVLKTQVDLITQKVAANNVKIIEVNTRKVEDSLTFYDKLVLTLQKMSTAAGFVNDNFGVNGLEKALKNNKEEVSDLKDENEQLLASLSGLIAQMNALGGDPTAKATQGLKRVKQEIIEISRAGLDEDLIQGILRDFKNAKVPLDAQIAFLSGMGLNKDAILKALLKAAEELPDAPVKVPNLELEVTQRTKFLGQWVTDDEKAKLEAAIQDIANNVQKTIDTAFQTAIDTQQRYIDKLTERIERQREIVAEEQQLSAAGAKNNLKTERERLLELERLRKDSVEKQRKLQQIQEGIDTAVQVSSLITAAAKIYESLSASGPVGVALAAISIGAMFAAFAASKIAAANAVAQGGYKKGGYTGDGDPNQEAGVVHKGEYVMPERLTKQYYDLFDGIYSGNNAKIMAGMLDLLEGTGVTLPDNTLSNNLKVITAEREREVLVMHNERLEAELVALRSDFNQYTKRNREQVIAGDGELVIVNGKNIRRVKYAK